MRMGYVRKEAIIAGCMILGAAVAAGPAAAAPLPVQFAAAGPILNAASEDAPGEELSELLTLARRLSPAIAAAALEAQAADAAARGAGALDDPELRIAAEDIARNGAGLPGRPGVLFFEVEQRFPWWTKRRLERSIADADAGRSHAAARLVQSELELRLKRSFADAWLASRAIALTEEIAADLRTILEVAAERYAIGLAGQGEVSEAEIALNAALIEKREREAELASAKARINALLDRDPDARLLDPVALPPIPAEELLTRAALFDLALGANPALAELRGEIAGARGNRGLADAAWYPDFAVGLGVSEGLSGGEDSYEAGVSLTIPLQWGVRRARVAEASARLNAAEHRLRAAQREIDASLASSLQALAASRFEGEILSGPDLRQAQAALASAEAAYPLRRAAIGDVLQARRRIRDLRLEHLRTEAEQRRLLAEIEFLIGGEL
jgi:outer membrane protein TolC